MTELERKLSQMTPKQRKATLEQLSDMAGMPYKEWIVSCNPDIYDLDQAFHDLRKIEWHI